MGMHSVTRTLSYVSGKEEAMKKGSALSEINEPFFITFDEYHLPLLQHRVFTDWRVLVVAFTTLSGSNYRVIYVRPMCTGLGVLGGDEIKEGVREVAHYIFDVPKLKKMFLGAVADNCPANNLAKDYLLGLGIPVLYDHEHLCGRFAMKSLRDVRLRWVYEDAAFRKASYKAVMTQLRSAPALDGQAAEYSVQLERIESFLDRAFAATDPSKVRLRKVNARLFESVGKV
ncbi:uncharacterized protein [Drosophila takahashii]|uniref:uncharacterized protein n=1 Tax=Drosophila takahashii TaxID=29030 RepID=UPI0038993001